MCCSSLRSSLGSRRTTSLYAIWAPSANQRPRKPPWRKRETWKVLGTSFSRDSFRTGNGNEKLCDVLRSWVVPVAIDAAASWPVSLAAFLRYRRKNLFLPVPPSWDCDRDLACSGGIVMIMLEERKTCLMRSGGGGAWRREGSSSSFWGDIQKNAPSIYQKKKRQAEHARLTSRGFQRYGNAIFDIK